MAILNITAAEINQAKALNAEGKTDQAWQLLGEKGDAYAYLASAILANDTAQMPFLARLFYEMVRIQWDNTAGAGLWGGQVFVTVGKDHFANYITLLERKFQPGSGYQLPTTIEIEASYKDALGKSALPPVVAIDALFSVIDTALGTSLDFSWAQMMDLANLAMGGPRWQNDRIVYNSDVFSDDVTTLDAAITLGRDIVNALDRAAIGNVLLPSPFAPLYWAVKLADGVLDYTVVDWANRIAALALLKTFGMTPTQADSLLSATSNDDHKSFAVLTDRIAGAVGLDLPASDINRTQLFTNIKTIGDTFSGSGLVVKSLVESNASEIALLAKSDIAYRYALRELNPFVLTGNSSLYEKHNTDGSLDLYNPSSGKGTMSELYLQDRAAMLGWKIKFDSGARDDDGAADDFFRTGDKSYNDDWDTDAIDGNWDYVDMSTKLPGGAPLTLQIDGRGASFSDHQIVFGSKETDVIEGSGDSDHLFGMSGNDQLDGKGGDDYLEGNVGNDTLVGGGGADRLYGGLGDDSLEGDEGKDILKGDKGFDTYQTETGDDVFDVDGQGRVYYKGVLLTGGEEGEQKGVYEGNGFKYILMGDGKSVRVIAGDGSITVSTGKGDFRVTEIWEQLYFLGNPAGAPRYMETRGQADNTPLGILLKDKEIRKRFVWSGDPLILDLDGDGIQTTALGSSSPFFDLGADGFAEQTGWVSKADGLLAIDRNNNGIIDDGRELFGDGTLLANGSIAKHGFEALADLDDNKDGEIDATDAIFSKLRIWQDADGDAQTDPGELKTLADAGVRSISLDAVLEDKMNNGNRIFAHGHYTCNDGTVMAAGDVMFSTTPYIGYDVANDADLGGLPDLAGSGSVPTLHAAMRAGDGAALKALVQQFVTESDAGKRLSLADDIFMAWSGAARSGDREAAVAAWYGGQETSDESSQNWQWRFTQVRDRINAQLAMAADFGDWYGSLDVKSDNGTLVADTSRWATLAQTERSANPAAFAEKCARFVNALAGLHDWEGRNLPTAVVRAVAAQDGQLADELYKTLRFNAQRREINGENSLIVSTVSDDFITLDTGINTIVFDRYSGNDTLIDWSIGVDILKLGDGIQAGDIELEQSMLGYNSVMLNLRNSDASMEIQSRIGVPTRIKVSFSDGSEWSWDDLIWRMEASDRLDRSLIQYGSTEADHLVAGSRGGMLIGGGGDDTLTASAIGSALTGDAGNDVLQGGAGNDTFDGGAGVDIYHFDMNGGSDEIRAVSRTGDGGDIIECTNGVTADGTLVIREDNDVALRFGNSVLRIKNWFSIPSAISAVRFADGTVWNADALAARVVIAPLGDTGELFGTTSADSMIGSAGDEYLDAGSGDDTLDGGGGADRLRGGVGKDTYRFGRGGGKDDVQDVLESATPSGDIILLDAGIVPDDLILALAGGDGKDLEISIAGTSDSLLFHRWFLPDGFAGDRRICFADGTSWGRQDIVAKLVVPATQGNDTLHGSAMADMIDGLAGADAVYGYGGDDLLVGNGGDDELYGLEGSDTLDGGTGNDRLFGGTGNDVFRFGHAYGQDVVVSDEYGGVEAMDRLAFSDDVAVSDVRLRRVGDFGNDLAVDIVGGSDRLIIESWFWSAVPVQELVFSDGTVWNHDDIVSRLTFDGSTGDDQILGSALSNTLSGLAGDDYLGGDDGNDTLSGGAGNDTLDGGQGDDTLDGGAGNDSLIGGWGNDRYFFGRGSGSDTLVGYGIGLDCDVLVLGSQILPKDLVVIRSGAYGGDLTMSIAGTSDRMVVENWFSVGSAAAPLSRIEFADGTVWTNADIVAHLSVGGTPSDDTIFGSDGNDAVEGLAGSDSLDGMGGNDLLSGGAGNDTLSGGDGDDTYVFGRGDGHDTIREQSVSSSTTAIRLGTQIKPADVLLSRDAATHYGLVLSISGTDDRLTLENWFNVDDAAALSIQFDDGTQWGNSEVLHRIAFPATPGADTLVGTDLGNTISGQAGDDTIYGYGGDDAVWGNGGDDSLDGADGADILYGSGGNDFLTGGAGDDTLDGGTGNDILSGGYGRDTFVLMRGYGQDEVSDYVPEDSGDYIQLGDDVGVPDIVLTVAGPLGQGLRVAIVGTGDSVVYPYFFSDWNPQSVEIKFADGTVWNAAQIGQRLSFTGGNGNDILLGTRDGDAISGGAGNDDLSGLGGNDTLDGGGGSDILQGGKGNDVYLFGRGYGQDTAMEEWGSTELFLDYVSLGDGIAPDDLTLMRQGDDLLVSIKGASDQLTLSRWFFDSTLQIEQLRFADGKIWGVQEISSHLAYQPSSGTNPLEGSELDDSISGQDGADDMRGHGGNDTLDGGAGADMLDGNSGNDVLIGGSGNDVLYGGVGNDTFDGGMGDDVIDLGAGNDTVLFGKGDGQDWVSFAAQGTENLFHVRFDALNLADVNLKRTENSLLIEIRGTDDVLTLDSWFGKNSILGGPTSRFDIPGTFLHFSDGTVLDSEAIWKVLALPSDRADFLVGTRRDDMIDALGGNDSVSGMEGNDWLEGGNGNDTLDGGAGGDTLSGGTGDDLLSGGMGTDCYLFGRGSGRDTVALQYSNEVSDDFVRIASDVLPSEIQYWMDTEYNLVLGLGQDSLVIQGWFSGLQSKVQRIEFSDGTIWDVAFLERAELHGTELDDSISGLDKDDVIKGFAGNDLISAGTGNDTLDGGSGNDQLDGGDGDDVFVFGKGGGQDTITDNDTTGSNTDTIRFDDATLPADVILSRETFNLHFSITGTSDKITVDEFFTDPAYRVEQVAFADGTTWDLAKLQAAPYLGTANADSLDGGDLGESFSGLGDNDTISAMGGNDTLDGGEGNDALDGGTGDDTYLFRHGAGQDTITDNDVTVANTDTIRFDDATLPTDVTLSRDAGSLYLSITGSSDKITVDNFFTDPAYRVEQIAFADGTAWDLAKLLAAPYLGTANADSLDGGDLAESFSGLGGNDMITANGGNDTLDGGEGNDSLDGGIGSDTYLFRRGSGQDTITDDDTTVGNTDTIRFDDATLPGDVILTRDASSLYLTYNGGSDKITVQGWFDATSSRIEQVKFADGTTWGTSTLAAAAFGGADTADTLYGTTGADKLYGFGGNDTLYGDTGNDTLDGGAGNDSLSGDGGNDIYLFGSGYGQDTVSETAGTDTVRFSAGITAANVLVSRDAANLYFSLSGTNDRLTIQDWYTASSYRIEKVEFADGATWDSAAIAARINAAGEGPDGYWGTTGNDTFNGLGGGDQLYGNAGNDSLTGGAGNDLLDGGTGTDTLIGGTGNDTYVVDNSTDVVTENANEGADTVQSTLTWTLGAHLENLTLTGSTAVNGTGNALDNILTGNAMDNTLDGGAGNDTLSGGAGNDTYVLDNPADSVSENANEGSDTIQAGFTYTLGANLEKLTLTGTTAIDGFGNELANTLTGNSAANKLVGGAGNDNLSAGAGNDTLEGNDGNDNLNGGAGTDTLTGGIGNDTYTVDNIGDTITENANEGTDKVNSAITWTLGANLENLTLTGSAAINGTGNTLDNLLTGNTGANVLTGGAGNDTYVVDNSADVVTENANEGTDTVQSAITWTLGANLENLTLTGSSAINGAGNTLNNLLTGNAADNTLDGGTGNDTLIGGAGNDTYLLDNSLDSVSENANEGTDTLQTGFSYTLGVNLENLTLTGSTAIDGTGNELANTLTGNSAANYLWGGLGVDALNGAGGNDILQGGDDTDTLSDTAGKNLLDGGAGADTLTGGTGNDLLIGGAGNDTLTTGAGADVILFNKGDGKDIVKASTGADNTLSLGGGIKYADLTFSKSSNNLILNTGTGESITLQNWYAATTNRSVLTLQIVADAMAGYDANATDPLLNKKVQSFDFAGLATRFDAALAATPTLTGWSLSSALLDTHLAGSDTQALGGDLAYQYGKAGSLNGIAVNAAQGVISSTTFGAQSQALQPLASLQDGLLKLAA